MIPTSAGSMITTLQHLEELDQITGLDETEVRTRREHGDGNDYRLASSRPLIDILRQNVLTVINFVLFSLAAALVSMGRWDEGLISINLIVMNIVIGLSQEIRAKRKLDRIALLTRPTVTVIREGNERPVDPAELVRGDIVSARPGDQIVVDGIVVGDGKMEVDESLITGESDLVPKAKGDLLLSGSFVATGSALYVARRVGAKSFANTIASEARVFRLEKTPLQRDVDFVIRALMLVAIFFGFLLAVSAYLSDLPLMRSVQAATVIAGLIPNGLFFMVIVAYAMGAVRISARGALVQQSNSVESLSNVNVLCMDKTGTLTANRIQYHDCCPVEIEKPALENMLGDFARSASVTNRTADALIDSLAGQARHVLDEVPFSSARQWSALTLSDDQRRGVYVLGAPETLASYLKEESRVGAIQLQAEAWTLVGLRVVMFAYSPDVVYLHDSEQKPLLPPLIPLGLVSFGDELRPEAQQTLADFAGAGVTLKVISGDNPQTVAALVRQAGLDGDLKLISGPELDALDDAQFDQAATQSSVFGRITPVQKEKLVTSLRRQGAYVAMIGDGVNDVLALKKAHLGIAMQNGSAAARGVADMVLLNDSFAALPPALLEGQRINTGMRDILRLYLARAVQLVLMILSVSVVNLGFPYIPKHISLVALLTIGIPTFALAVWARPHRDHRRLVVSVLHFALPAGMTSFLFGFLLYTFTFNSIVNEGRTIDVLHDDVKDFQTYTGINYEIYTQDQFVYEVANLFSQSVLTVYSMLIGLALLLFVEPPWPWFVGGDRFSGEKRVLTLAAIMFGLFVLVMAVPSFRSFWELLPLEPLDYALVIGAVALWIVVVRYVWRAQLFERFLHLDALIDLSE
ncbi:MAG: HAD-IC family P-type ATPase [Chloroflexi bacterium]|nr:HAD-IC family P-type ATPase [Chloroflexota bacterium]